jgi:S1-C subfamily serine protease
MKQTISFWVLVALLAIVGGALAGVVTSTWYVSPQFQILERNLRERLDHATSSVGSPVEVVRVEREPAAPVIPPLFLQGRRSLALLLVKRGAHPQDEQTLNEDRILGSVSTLTTDGWLLAPAHLFEGLHAADVGVVWEGRVYPLTKAVRDTSSDLVYAKVALQNLPVAGFIRSEDVVNGLPVWIETTPGRIAPQVVIDVHERAFHGLVSSERMTRRYMLNGDAASFGKGGVVWSGKGELVGVLEVGGGLNGSAAVIPAASVAHALSSILATQEIRRASLGVNGMNAAFLFAEASSSAVRPAAGFLLRGDRAHAIAAVENKGAAAKFLKEGDVIERIDNDVIQDATDVAERLEEYRPGTILPVYGMRAGSPFQMNIALGEVVTSELLK